MNILLISQNYLPFVGGIETQVRLVANRLAERHGVTVAAGNFAPCRLPRRLGVLHTSMLAPAYAGYRDGKVWVEDLTPDFKDRLRMLPVAVRAVPGLQRCTYHGLHRLGYRAYRSVYLPRFRRLMKNTDVVHAHAGSYIAWAAWEAAHQLGLPFVCTPYVHPKQWGDGPEDIAFYRRCDAVIGLLESDRRNLRDSGVPESLLHTIGVIPSVAPNPKPEEFRREHGLEGKPIVLYVGRLVTYKGAQAILKAAPKVWKEFPEARFVFIGPAGETEAAWFTQSDPRILYLGKRSDEEKSDALAACDVFCMPSVSEILPTVYLEAWSYGKPVVGGKAPGLPELVEGNDAGITVDQTPESISRALIHLLHDPILCAHYGRQGQTLVTHKYSLEAVSSQTEALYEHLIREKASNRDFHDRQYGIVAL